MTTPDNTTPTTPQPAPGDPMSPTGHHLSALLPGATVRTLVASAFIPGIAAPAMVSYTPRSLSVTVAHDDEELATATAAVARLLAAEPPQPAESVCEWWLPCDTIEKLLTTDITPEALGLGDSALVWALHAVRLAIDAGWRGDVVNRDIAHMRLNAVPSSLFDPFIGELGALVKFAREAQVEVPGELTMGEKATRYEAAQSALAFIGDALAGKVSVREVADIHPATPTTVWLAAILAAVNIANDSTNAEHRKVLADLRLAAGEADSVVRWCSQFVADVDARAEALTNAEEAARQASLALSAEVEAHADAERTTARATHECQTLRAENDRLERALAAAVAASERADAALAESDRAVAAAAEALAPSERAAEELRIELAALRATLDEERSEHAITRSAYTHRLEEFTLMEKRAVRAEEALQQLANDHAVAEAELRGKLNAALDTMSVAASAAQERTMTLEVLESEAARLAARYPDEELAAYIRRAFTTRAFTPATAAVVESQPEVQPEVQPAVAPEVLDVEVPGPGDVLRPENLPASEPPPAPPIASEPPAPAPQGGANEPDPWATPRGGARRFQAQAEPAPAASTPPPAAIVTPPPVAHIPVAPAVTAPELTEAEVAAIRAVATARYLKDVVSELHARFPQWSADEIRVFLAANATAVPVTRRIPEGLLSDRITSTCIALRIN